MSAQACFEKGFAAGKDEECVEHQDDEEGGKNLGNRRRIRMRKTTASTISMVNWIMRMR